MLSSPLRAPTWTPVAASSALAGLVEGPPLACRVVVSGRLAAYIGAPSGQVVAVVSRGADVPSCALVLPDGARPDTLLAAGTTVVVGGAQVVAAATTLRVTRWWSPDSVTGSLGATVPPAGARALLRRMVAERSTGLDAEAARARSSAPAAARAAAGGDTARAASLVTDVLGLGPGLTPSGDDVTAGLLLGLRATGVPDDLDRLAQQVSTAARTRTTVVSAGLLAEAAAGRAGRPVVQAVRALVDGAPDLTMRSAFSRLLDVGHLSGADTAAGMLAAADAVAEVAEVADMVAIYRGTATHLAHRRTA